MASELEKFLEERSMIPIPGGEVGRVKLLAKELALGVHKDLWGRATQRIFFDSLPIDKNQSRYLETRWGDSLPTMWMELLQGHGYMEDAYNSRGNRYDRLSSTAFALLQETLPHTVFVSYRHAESSAFALLVVTKLKEFGLLAYCDMRLAPGDAWHPELEDQVKASEFVVVLLGSTTLCSSAVIEEIEWAIDADATVIPITHNSLDFKREEWEDSVPSQVLDKIEHNHRIPIPREHENAAGYDVAIRTLLVNRFGVSL